MTPTDRPRLAPGRVAIDLNADLGEGFGEYGAGSRDAELLSVITSANVACGFHAGDPRTLEATVMAARTHGVHVGAHPGFPDLVGFGRRPMRLQRHEITTDVVYQIGALAAFCHRHGVELHHVKPHGALGHQAWQEPDVADAILDAIASVDPGLIVVALAGSVLEVRARDRDMHIAREAFLDRAYLPDGQLVPRARSGAVLHNEEEIVRRARQLALEGSVRAVDGTIVEVRPDTMCLHGDTRGAAGLVAAVRAALAKDGVQLAPPSSEAEAA